MSKNKKDISFEEAIGELELTVQHLENGNLGLDESLTEFKKGIELYKYCYNLLNKVEGEIKVLINNESGHLIETDLDEYN